MKIKSRTFIAPLLLGSILAIGACNDSDTKEKVDTKEVAEKHNEAKFDKVAEKDAQQVVNAYASGLYEIKLADTVSKYARTKEAKNLAGMLGDGHRKINAELKDLAAKKQITLPTDVTPGQTEKINKMKEEKKMELDKDYTSSMTSKHKESITMYERCSTECADPEIKSWFGKTIPELRKHLDMAMNSEEKIKAMKK